MTPAAPSQAPASGTYESGSRLRAKLWQGDGAALFEGWKDTMLGVDCRFRPEDDGTWRCLPAESDAVVLYTAPTTFLDASCTEAAYVSSPGPLPAFAVWELTGCNSDNPVMQVYSVGAAGGTTVYTQAGGSCIAGPVPAGQVVHALVAVDRSLFVTAHVVEERRGAGLDVEVLVGDDGTKQLGRVLDHAHAWRCGVPSDDAPPPYFSADLVQERCLPIEVADAEGEFYTSADCASPATGAWTCAVSMCPPTTIGLSESADGCAPPTVALFNITDAVVTAYGLDGGACTAVMIGGGCEFHVSSGAIDVGQLPALVEKHIGTGRLAQVLRTAGDDDRPLAESRSQLWDMQSGTPCSPAQFTDGKSRCMTARVATINNFAVVEYADAACTQRVVGGSGGCAPAPLYANQLYQDGNLVYGYLTQALFSVGPTVSGPIYLTNNGGACTLANTSPGDRYWLVGEPVDPDSVFAALTERTE